MCVCVFVCLCVCVCVCVFVCLFKRLGTSTFCQAHSSTNALTPAVTTETERGGGGREKGRGRGRGRERLGTSTFRKTHSSTNACAHAHTYVHTFHPTIVLLRTFTLYLSVHDFTFALVLCPSPLYTCFRRPLSPPPSLSGSPAHHFSCLSLRTTPFSPSLSLSLLLSSQAMCAAMLNREEIEEVEAVATTLAPDAHPCKCLCVWV